jgi:5-methylcytosine-specific restriction endonuclease McrA
MCTTNGRKSFKKRVFRLINKPICYICEKAIAYEDATVDHYIPKHLGGKDKLKNYELACIRCNNEKSHFVNSFYKQQRKKNRVPDNVRYST